jgi:hypothetical protein
MKVIVTCGAIALIAFATVLPSAAQQIIYDDGPINGTYSAETINVGFIVADSFTVSSGTSTLNGLTFGAWLFPGDVLDNVQVWVTSGALGGTTYFNQVVNFTQSACSSNQFGFNVCTESGTFSGPTLANGTYWLNLLNATVNDGDPVYWDENSGIGCTSPGCPSEATCNSCIVKGNLPPQLLPAEAFTIYGEPASTVPEPSSFLLFGSGVLGLIGIARRKLR